MMIREAKIDERGDLVEVVAIPCQLAPKIWPMVEQYAAAALEHAFDGMTSEKILDYVLDDVLILVVITYDGEIVASATLEIDENENGKSCHCLTIGGEGIDFWIAEFMEVWRAIAREQGCDAITLKGREGWARYARKLGFQHQYTQMRMAV